MQWRRKIFFYGYAHIFPAIVVNFIFYYMGRIRELGGTKTSPATTRQLGSMFIVYSLHAVPSFPGRLAPPTNQPGNEAKSAGARLNKGGVPAPGTPPLPMPLLMLKEKLSSCADMQDALSIGAECRATPCIA